MVYDAGQCGQIDKTARAVRCNMYRTPGLLSPERDDETPLRSMTPPLSASICTTVASRSPGECGQIRQIQNAANASRSKGSKSYTIHEEITRHTWE